ncbi:hypothetical protein [uncultured Bilophila sp.]|uniref:hypothetical protein n=1 Tax=uncultured Bilophila sp. TaxID=529385 RepID=UPI00266F7F5B|nr:hypothetical protein [uncultured Bilophila sp.]
MVFLSAPARHMPRPFTPRYHFSPQGYITFSSHPHQCRTPVPYGALPRAFAHPFDGLKKFSLPGLGLRRI